MADIRIKDLTTEAPTSVTSDFLPIDGNTGTRKLSAYSPTFGGNATVGGTLGVTGTTTLSAQDLILAQSGVVNWTIRNTTTSGILDIRNGSGSFLTFPVSAGTVEFNATNASTVKVSATTASTSTSSGALVVSGGVGVAGNVSSGGQVAATGTGTSGPYIANSAVIDYDSSTARFYGRGPNTSTRPSLGFYSTYSDGAGGLTLMTFNTSGAATIASSLTTGAPSGGTAAAWKLGAVASVSPTSPNRTIEVDIGGTIYYIHAKTTNN